MHIESPSRIRPHRPAVAGLAATMIVMGVASCGGSGQAAGEDGSCNGDPAKKVTIAYQPGLGYAPLLVAKQQKSLEGQLSGVTIQWRELNSGAAIRDGMVSGDIQVGSGGIGPFLVGVDSGIDEKVAISLNNMSLWLMAKKPDIKTLEDLKGAGKIAMPGPDSIQAVVLKKAAQKQLGDPKALDSQIVAMGHPDGVQALIGGQLAAHLTSPPFQQQEQERGAHKIVTSYEVFGEHTFNSVFTKTDFAACNPKFMDALVDGVQSANKLLTNSPAKASQLLSKEMGIPPAKVKAQITADEVKFTSTPKGFGTFAKFMNEIGLIKEVPKTKDLFFQNAATKGAS